VNGDFGELFALFLSLTLRIFCWHKITI
jgi:hypothetical protein